MTDIDPQALDAERRSLMGVAYRMLGTVADAEDAVQETFTRWYRLPAAERTAIASPGAWLTRVASRVCLDTLTSAHARRETYVGQWLPEPLPSASASALAPPDPPDPLDRMTLEESVSTALLVVLESLTPAQRVAFVLHDVFAVPFGEIAESVGRSAEACRQLASQARRHVRERRSGTATRHAHDTLARAFAFACTTGDLAQLMEVLDPDVVLRSDGGGTVSAATRPVMGADRVARFILGLPRLVPRAEATPIQTPDGLGFVVRLDGAVNTVITLGVRGTRVTDIWIMRNPAKLLLWN